jgi:hypothetical protein
MIKAKPILKDKFWIIEQNGSKLGTLSVSDDQYLYSCDTGTRMYSNQRQLNKALGGKIHWSESISDAESSDNIAYEYPTSTTPHNIIWDVKQKLPLFTKSKKSKSLYAAGYYIIKFDKGWVKSFCPKLITIQRYDFKGPFKNDLQMRVELSNANKSAD